MSAARELDELYGVLACVVEESAKGFDPVGDLRALGAQRDRYRDALNLPLRETILAVLRQMPTEAAPEHLAAQIEDQVRAWQATVSSRMSREDWNDIANGKDQ